MGERVPGEQMEANEEPKDDQNYSSSFALRAQGRGSAERCDPIRTKSTDEFDEYTRDQEAEPECRCVHLNLALRGVAGVPKPERRPRATTSGKREIAPSAV